MIAISFHYRGINIYVKFKIIKYPRIKTIAYALIGCVIKFIKKNCWKVSCARMVSQLNILPNATSWRVTSVCIILLAPHHILVINASKITLTLCPRLDCGCGEFSHFKICSLKPILFNRCFKKTIPPQLNLFIGRGCIEFQNVAFSNTTH